MHASAQERSLAETAEQAKFRESGDPLGYYNSRCSAGDAYACQAAMVVKNEWGRSVKGTAMAYANLRLKAFAFPLSVNLKEVQLKLMNAHATYVAGDELGVKGLLNPTQIMQYHHEVFEGMNLPFPHVTFGGTPITGTSLDLKVTSWIWCEGCDSQ